MGREEGGGFRMGNTCIIFFLIKKKKKKTNRVKLLPLLGGQFLPTSFFCGNLPSSLKSSPKVPSATSSIR